MESWIGLNGKKVAVLGDETERGRGTLTGHRTVQLTQP